MCSMQHSADSSLVASSRPGTAGDRHTPTVVTTGTERDRKPEEGS